MQLYAGDIKDKLPPGILQLEGRQAPDLILNNMDDETWDIKQSRGHWLFVHFWASWCGPCRREMPTIQRISEQLDEKKLEIILINTAEDEDTVFEFLSFAAPDLIPLLDTEGLVTKKWKPRGLPSTFFIDPEGKMRFLALGGRPWDQTNYLNFLKTLITRP